MSVKERIAKRISAAGLCSRREAEKWITEGRVRLNGDMVTTPATLTEDHDVITVDDKPIQKQEEACRIFLLNKPAGVLCTRTDPHGRPTIYDFIPPHLPRLVYVGRLDLNSEGLLVLTTSGNVAKVLSAPSTALERTYRVRTFGKLNDKQLELLRHGMKISDTQYQPAHIEEERPKGHKGESHLKDENSRNRWYRITIREGKNREIRKLMEHFGLKVNRLIRVQYGPFKLASLQRGGLMEAPYRTVSRIVEQVEKGTYTPHSNKPRNPNPRKAKTAPAARTAEKKD